ncbi:hypothetical protein DAI22_06g211600 [Oryza sativa Japonica Group]|nr:hypothetical protein DAI22_06g211600 [Oryza sativa Japonica Group]
MLTYCVPSGFRISCYLYFKELFFVSSFLLFVNDKCQLNYMLRCDQWGSFLHC